MFSYFIYQKSDQISFICKSNGCSLESIGGLSPSLALPEPSMGMLAGNKKVCCMRKSTTFKSGLRYCLFIGIELCVFADMSAKVFSNNWNLSGIARTNISFFKNKLVILYKKISLNQMFCGEFFKLNHKRSV